MIQRLKRRRGFSSAYKPSVLVNEARIIVAQTVDPASETRVIADLLAQHYQLSGCHPKTLLLDAGYFHDEMIAETQKHQILLFCPDGNERQSQRKIYPKSRFIYHAEKDLYLCPANDKLRLVSTVKPSEKSRGHRVYTGANCADCLKKEKCTQAKKGRKIKRYPEDEARDKLRSRMTQPESKRILSQRKVMVEPVFSALRGIPGLERFRRRGLSAVRVEFTLHAIAYNLSRAVALILWVIFSLSWVVSPNNRQ